MLREVPVTSISIRMVSFVIGLRGVANFGEFVVGAIENPTAHHSDMSLYRTKVFNKHALIVKWMSELDELREHLSV